MEFSNRKFCNGRNDLEGISIFLILCVTLWRRIKLGIKEELGNVERRWTLKCLLLQYGRVYCVFRIALTSRLF